MLNVLVNRLAGASAVGVDLGSTKLKVVRIAWADGRAVLRGCAVADAADPAAVVRALKEALSGPVRGFGEAAIALASPELIVKSVRFPALKKKELASAIQLEAEQAILNGHTISDMAIDWHPLASESQESLRGLLAVVPKTIITDRVKPLAAAGLRATIIDVEGLALWNAYWTLAGRRGPAGKAVLLVNVGARTTNLVMVKGQDELLLLRDLGLGAAALRAGQQADWLEEIRDSLAYARAKTGLRSLDAAYLTGGGATPELAPALQPLTTTPVTIWNPLADLARDAKSPAVDDSLGPLLGIAIGLALRRPV